MKRSRNNKGQFQRRTDGEMFEGFAVYLDVKGYKLIWLDGRDVKIHVFVWERANGPKPDGFDIHHRDLDRGNYELSNLQLLSFSDHKRLHAGWLKTGDEWTHKPCTGCSKVLTLDKFYCRKGHTPTALCKPCHCEKTRLWSLANEEKRRKIGRDYYHRHKGRGHAREI